MIEYLKERIAREFKDKLLGEFINDSTKILTKFTEGYDCKSVKLYGYIDIYEAGEKTVVASYETGMVLIMDNSTQKADAIFNVYEMEHASLNKKRGLVTARGHETIHQYWLDDGEYEAEHTR